VKIHNRPLSGTPLATAWLNRSPEALALFSRDPSSIESYLAKAEEVDARVGKQERLLAASCLVGGGDNAKKRIDEFIEGHGFMVTTGQQPGLFGGPLYGLYKGLTAAALARRLEGVLERPVIPVFWIASEDHDWDEARGTHVIDVGNDLHEVSLPPGEPGVDRPLYRIPAGQEIMGALDLFCSFMPDTEFLPYWRTLLAKSYRSDRTLAEAFQDVLEILLGPAGVFLVQSHHQDLKARALPILLRELRESGDRETALRMNGASIKGAGFELQVPLIPDATNVFIQGEVRRERVFRDGSSFRLRGSNRRLSLTDVEALGNDDPSCLSPNVLLRPVIESALFPTLSYVAGPGEAAYLPQTAPLFAGHGIEMPVVHPRVSLAVVEGKIDKVLGKFHLAIDDMAEAHQEVAGRLVRERIPSDVQSGLERLRKVVSENTDLLLDSVSRIDSTLSGPVKAFRRHSFALLTDVERKIVQSLKKENHVALAQVAKAQLHLFPGGWPQERVLNPFYYLVRYDWAFLEALRDHADRAVLPLSMNPRAPKGVER